MRRTAMIPPVLLAGLAALGLSACGDGVRVGDAPQAEPDGHGADEDFAPGVEEDLGGGLVRERTAPGRGPAATPQSTVTVHYRAFLAADFDGDGEQEPAPFDSSTSRRVPLVLRPGGPRVVSGLARGVVGLRPGSAAVLRVPAALAWGAVGNPSVGVPPDADLVFEVRVLEVE